PSWVQIHARSAPASTVATATSLAPTASHLGDRLAIREVSSGSVVSTDAVLLDSVLLDSVDDGSAAVSVVSDAVLSGVVSFGVVSSVSVNTTKGTPWLKIVWKYVDTQPGVSVLSATVSCPIVPSSLRTPTTQARDPGGRL